MDRPPPMPARGLEQEALRFGEPPPARSPGHKPGGHPHDPPGNRGRQVTRSQTRVTVGSALHNNTQRPSEVPVPQEDVGVDSADDAAEDDAEDPACDNAEEAACDDAEEAADNLDHAADDENDADNEAEDAAGKAEDAADTGEVDAIAGAADAEDVGEDFWGAWPGWNRRGEPSRVAAFLGQAAERRAAGPPRGRNGRAGLRSPVRSQAVITAARSALSFGADVFPPTGDPSLVLQSDQDRVRGPRQYPCLLGKLQTVQRAGRVSQQGLQDHLRLHGHPDSHE